MRHVHLPIAVAIVFAFSPFAQATIATNGVAGPGADDGIITLIYNPDDGHLSLDAADEKLIALEIVSTGRNFVNIDSQDALSMIDVYSPGKIFILRPIPSQFGDKDFRNIFRTGLTIEQIASDLTISGTIYPNGPIGEVDLRYTPEPSSLSLLGISLLAICRARRRK